MDSANRSPGDPPTPLGLRSANGAIHDLAALLNVIRGQASSTRLLLARETGLSRSVITQRLADLRASGLIVESGNDASSGGRP
ncbi:MAG: winged helix-turn-helix domain-containing protein, partial [Chloroflexota bacterium]|nr:winged helix-turn-helix domain-containing protein [Chloroflexota bacterium]